MRVPFNPGPTDRFPGYGEGHPEDHCPLCYRPVSDHPCLRHRLVWLALWITGGLDR